jgi:hypothetical protein
MMGTHHRIVRKIKAADEPSDVSGIPLIVIPPDFCTLALLHDSSQSLALRVQVKATAFFSSVRKAGLCLSFRSRRPSLPQRTKPPCLTNAPQGGRHFGRRCMPTGPPPSYPDSAIVGDQPHLPLSPPPHHFVTHMGLQLALFPSCRHFSASL